jgi:succinate-acetate transporter protein
MRSSWVLFLTLLSLDVELLLLAAGYMANSSNVLVAGNSVGFVVGFFACKNDIGTLKASY